MFWLGTHQPHWLAKTDVPLMVSDRTLKLRKSLPRAQGLWVLDSGGYSELSLHGEWKTPPQEYAERVRRYRDEIGGLQWAAIADWMCEPWIIQKTGLSVQEHQQRTIDSWFTLKNLAPDLPWIPILQGWSGRDYQRHADDWCRRGVDLTAHAVVGIGSVCRRQGTTEGVEILRLVSWLGLRLHGFGVKISGLRRAVRYLASADSMAWSYAARRAQRCVDGHTSHKNGANCLAWALWWMTEKLGKCLSNSAANRANVGMWVAA